MFFRLFVPSFSQALRRFSWITWIAPQSFQSRLHHKLFWGNGLQSMDDIRLQQIWYWQVDRAPFLNLPSTDGMPLADLIIIAGCSEIFCWTSYMPINANGVYDHTGGTYNGASLLDECVKLSPGKYAEYGPPFTPLITPFSMANPMLGTPWCLLIFKYTIGPL